MVRNLLIHRQSPVNISKGGIPPVVDVVRLDNNARDSTRPVSVKRYHPDSEPSSANAGPVILVVHGPVGKDRNRVGLSHGTTGARSNTRAKIISKAHEAVVWERRQVEFSAMATSSGVAIRPGRSD